MSLNSGKTVVEKSIYWIMLPQIYYFRFILI